jgi:apolipoprotein N-acyltransferase
MNFAATPVLRAMLISAAAVCSAGAYFASFGLHPVWWLVWLAPLPVLVLAPQLRAWQAFAMAFGARALAGLNIWHYVRHDIHIPFGVALVALLIPAAFFSLAVLLFRSLSRKAKPQLAILGFPAALVAAEYLLSLVQGTFGNTAYTQLQNLPILQLAALTGVWGISFTVYLFSAGIAAMVSAPAKVRTRIAIAFAAYYVVVLSYGEIRLHSLPQGQNHVLIGMIETHAGANFFPTDKQTTMVLMRAYATEVRFLAAGGAQVVLLPEMTALVPDPLSAQVDSLFQRTARDAGVEVLLGVKHVTDHGSYNEARLYSTSGEIEAVYRKHHLVPTLEAHTTPGNAISVVPLPEGRVGIEICRDLDYPELARRYGQHQVALILAPAWDQGADAVWHGHMSIMRSVEDGFALVRDAKMGLLTASDNRGRILSEKSTRSDGALTNMLAAVPMHYDTTLYQRWGDWFAWVDLMALASLFLFWRTS